MPYGRGYCIGDHIYPSMTTVLGSIDNTALDEWVSRVGVEEATRVSKRATDKGTAVHSLCEDYLNNKLTSFEGYDRLSIDGFLSIQSILDDHITNIIAQEVSLYSHKLKMAGRVDLIAEYDGILSIIDFKTSSRTKEKSWIEKYFMQETGYCVMFYEMTGIKISQLVTIITVENEDPQVFIEKPQHWFDKLKEARLNFQQKWEI